MEFVSIIILDTNPYSGVGAYTRNNLILPSTQTTRMSNAPTLLKTTNDIQGSIPYTPVKKNNVPYKGQRKLLIMLLDFVNNTHHLSNTIVYAGAADGTNIGVVAELYPKHQFHLYDPRPFNVAPRPNIHIHQGYFTDDDARSYFDKPVLFVSDIRTMNNAKSVHAW